MSWGTYEESQEQAKIRQHDEQTTKERGAKDEEVRDLPFNKYLPRTLGAAWHMGINSA